MTLGLGCYNFLLFISNVICICICLYFCNEFVGKGHRDLKFCGVLSGVTAGMAGRSALAAWLGDSIICRMAADFTRFFYPSYTLIWLNVRR